MPMILKKITTAIILTILVAQLFVPFYKAEALGGVADVTFNTPIAELLSSPQWWRNFILKPIARFIAGFIIRAMTNQVVSWIQGTDASGPSFFQNLESELLREADAAGAEFFQKLTGVNLCGDFSARLRLILTAPPGFKKKFECTLSEGVENLQNFYNNFEDGGWATFFSLMQNENNYYGILPEALEADLGGQSAKQLDILRKFAAQAGFKGFETKEEVDDPNGVCDVGADGEIVCSKKIVTVTKTPGQTIAQTLQKSIDVGFDFASVADELDEAIATVINALINKIITSSIAGSSGSGLTNSELSKLEFNINPNSSINRQITDGVQRAQAAQGAIDAKIAEIDEEIASLEAACSDDDDATKCDRGKIDSLKAEKEDLLAKRARLDDIIDKLLTTQEQINNTNDPAIMEDLGFQLGAVLSDLETIINELGRPEGTDPGQSFSRDPRGNTIKIIDNSLTRASSAIAVLNQKIAAENDPIRKAKLIKARDDIQQLANELQRIKNKLSAIDPADTEGVKQLTSEAIQKIKEMNQKITDAEKI